MRSEPQTRSLCNYIVGNLRRRRHLDVDLHEKVQFLDGGKSAVLVGPCGDRIAPMEIRALMLPARISSAQAAVGMPAADMVRPRADIGKSANVAARGGRACARGLARGIKTPGLGTGSFARMNRPQMAFKHWIRYSVRLDRPTYWRRFRGGDAAFCTGENVRCFDQLLLGMSARLAT